MSTINNIDNTYNKYNDEPVEYCPHCLSLAIREEDGIKYCDKCGNTEIKETDIFTWENLYQQRYGTFYIKKDGK